ncbi:Serine carboxypeptidase-like 51 [Dichanthelium oligosanthes]|uniref:Carboxypeptidase n=1 Tax=Dichanthelium oligosanthes TaxID=888268 RepID=A0A1E5VG47_9POAL|nr:Serine carboxypeptidase-like 51 [Dichanthelium oligosanthes]
MDMPCYPVALLLLLLCLGSLHAGSTDSITTGTPDGSELWGYVEVRPKAHLFWWYYKSPQRTSTPSKPWPTVLWLQGGPGASGVGLGNFQEIGPLDINLQPRNSTWLQKADLIFLDNPVGTGYSYVENKTLFVTTDWQQAADATTLLKALVTEVPTLQSSPLFLVAESYGGKYAATLGVSIARAARAGELNITLAGVALGDSWISPEDFTLSYTPLLLSVSRLDDNAGDEANKRAETVKQQIAAGQWAASQQSWNDMLDFIATKSGDVDVYNFLLDTGMDPVSVDASSTGSSLMSNLQARKYSTYLSSQDSAGSNTIDGIMNGVIREKLKIIPKDFKYWRLFDKLGVFLVQIDELLSYGINVTVYNGQVDVICSTDGAEAWVQKLKWDGLKTFLSLPRQSLYCGASKGVKAFVRSYKNLHFYWILGAGHYVPVDQPCIALSMISNITQSPANHGLFDMDRPRCPLALLPLLLCLCLASLRAGSTASVNTGTPDGSERWGYVEVRPQAHLFWWYYKSPQRTSTPTKPWPTVLWLQGGPGASGVGLGNFLEVGPLDVDLKPRNSTWLQKADLIFVDNPVGVGYSYVEDDSLLVTTDWQQAADATTLLKALVKELPTLQTGPLYLVAESYGGKYAATLGASIARAVRAGELKITLGGVALGDSWISPEDFTLSYTPLLLSVSRLDDNAGGEANKRAEKVKEQIAKGQFADAQGSWNDLLGFIGSKSGDVDVYNFLLDSGMDPVSADTPTGSSASNVQALKYATYLGSQDSGSNTIDSIMNGVIKEKLKIVPKDLKWVEVSQDVYNALVNDFMKPRIDEIDELLSYGINVTVYNGQLDVICSTDGAEAWVQKLKWDGLKSFLSLPRQPLYCGQIQGTKAFVRSYKNLHFYWILGAGHFVPADQPCIALSMISSITQSPAS